VTQDGAIIEAQHKLGGYFHPPASPLHDTDEVARALLAQRHEVDAPLAASNFLGPVLLAPLFDVVGRRAMIAGTYAAAGVLLTVTAVLLGFDAFTAWTQTIAWMVIFFFASAAASSAYLTASEIFPLEMRAIAIAIFYAVGTAIGGATGPSLFGYLIGTGAIVAVAGGYAIAAVLMLIAAAAELRFGIDAERRPLESIAQPLSVE
jgi:MFS family permease